MTATQHPTLENHWFVNETQTVQQTTTDEEGNEVTTDVEVIKTQYLVASKEGAESAIAAIENPAGDPE